MCPDKDFELYSVLNNVWLKEFKFANNPSTFRKNHSHINIEHKGREIKYEVAILNGIWKKKLIDLNDQLDVRAKMERGV